MTDTPAWQFTVSAILFVAVYLLVRYAWGSVMPLLRRREAEFDRVLNQQLLMDVPARWALVLMGLGMLVCGLALYIIGQGLPWLVLGLLIGLTLPGIVLRHLAQKRAQRLEEQLVDGIVTLSSGARAGLNLVQSFELLVNNMVGPIHQEFAQMLREYQMGLDLNQAMRNAAGRIGSSNYRLLFTALEMHRRRGGNTAESLDRIAESIREIQRLEGKLDALTAQGRTQARMMAAIPVLVLFVFYEINPEGVTAVFVEPIGRVLLLLAAGMIVAAFFWIRRIMTIDI